MAVIIPEGYASVGIQMRRAGDPDPWYVTYGVSNVPAFSGLEDWAGGILGQWDAIVGGVLPTDTAFTGIQLRVGVDGSDPLSVFYPANYQGRGGGATLPQNCAVLITKVTGRSGRTGKGRMFWPTILESNVNGLGLIDPDYRGTLQTIWNTLYTAHLDGSGDFDGAPMFLLHNEGVPFGADPTQIVSLTVDPIISTQRGRLR